MSVTFVLFLFGWYPIEIPRNYVLVLMACILRNIIYIGVAMCHDSFFFVSKSWNLAHTLCMVQEPLKLTAAKILTTESWDKSKNLLFFVN